MSDADEHEAIKAHSMTHLQQARETTAKKKTVQFSGHAYLAGIKIF